MSGSTSHNANYCKIVHASLRDVTNRVITRSNNADKSFFLISDTTFLLRSIPLFSVAKFLRRMPE